LETFDKNNPKELREWLAEHEGKDVEITLLPEIEMDSARKERPFYLGKRLFSEFLII